MPESIADLVARTKNIQLQQTLGKQQNKVTALGGTVKHGGPSILSRVLDVVSRPLYGVSEGIARASEHKNIGNIAAGVAGGLAGKNKEDIGGALMRSAVADPGSLLSGAIRHNKGNLRTIAGLTGDVILDPTTYVGGDIIKAGGEGLAKAAGLRAVSEHLASEGVAKGLREAGQRAVVDASEKRALSGAEALSQKEMGKITKKAIGDASLAEGRPAYSSAYQAAKTNAPGKVALKFAGKTVGESERLYSGAAKVGEAVRGTTVGNKLHAAFSTSHLLPEETKSISRKISQAGVKGYEKDAKAMRGFFKDLTPEEKRMVSHSIEQGNQNMPAAERQILTGKGGRSLTDVQNEIKRIESQHALGDMPEGMAATHLERLQAEKSALQEKAAQKATSAEVGARVPKTVDEARSLRSELRKAIEGTDERASDRAARLWNKMDQAGHPLWKEAKTLDKAEFDAARIHGDAAPIEEHFPPFTKADQTIPRTGKPTTARPVENILGRTPGQAAKEDKAAKAAATAAAKPAKVPVESIAKAAETAAPAAKVEGKVLLSGPYKGKSVEEAQSVWNSAQKMYELTLDPQEQAKLRGLKDEISRAIEETKKSPAKGAGQKAVDKVIAEKPKAPVKAPAKVPEAAAATATDAEKKYAQAVETHAKTPSAEGLVHKGQGTEYAVNRARSDVLDEFSKVPENNARGKKIQELDNTYYKHEGTKQNLRKSAAKNKAAVENAAKAQKAADEIDKAKLIRDPGALQGKTVAEAEKYAKSLDSRIKASTNIADREKLIKVRKQVDRLIERAKSGEAATKGAVGPSSDLFVHAVEPGGDWGSARYRIKPAEGGGFDITGPHYSDGSWPRTAHPADRAVALEAAYKETGYEGYRKAAQEEHAAAVTHSARNLTKETETVEKLGRTQAGIKAEQEALQAEHTAALNKHLEDAAARGKAANSVKNVSDLFPAQAKALGTGEKSKLAKVMERLAAKETPAARTFAMGTGKAAEKVAEEAPKVAPKVIEAAPKAAAAPVAEVAAKAAPIATETPISKLATALKERPVEDITIPSMEKAASHPEDTYRSTLHGVKSKAGKDLGDYVDKAREYFSHMGQREADMGIFKDVTNSKGVKTKAHDLLNPDYVYHYYTGGTDAEREAFKTSRRKIFGSDVPTFTKQRVHSTLEAAKTKGLKPVEEIDDILALRMGKHINAVSRRQFVEDVSKMYGTKLSDKVAKTVAKEQDLRTVRGVPGLKGVYFPDHIARSLEAHEALNSSTKAGNDFLKLFDKVQSHWKFSATGLNPGHHIRNMVGDAWNNYLDGVTDPRRYALSGRLMSAKNPAEIATKIGEVTVDGEKLLQHNITSGAAPGFFSSEFGASGKSALHPSAVKQKLLEMGEKREEYMRLAHFIDAFKDEGKGIKASWSAEKQAEELSKAADRAAGRVRKWNIDYGDMTEFETKVMKRALPFYTWTRKNLPLQLEALALHPGRIASIPKGQSAIQRVLGTDVGYNQAGPEIIPKWLKEMAPIRLSGEGSTGHSMFGVPALPFQDIGKYTEGGKQGILRSIVSQMTPIARIPIEQATGQSLFSGAPIKSDTDYLSQQMPMVRILNALRQGKLTKSQAINYVTGAGVYDVGPAQAASELRRQQQPLKAQTRALKASALKKITG